MFFSSSLNFSNNGLVTLTDSFLFFNHNIGTVLGSTPTLLQAFKIPVSFLSLVMCFLIPEN